MKTKFSNQKDELDTIDKQLEMLRDKYTKGLQALEDKKDECARMREEIQDYIREYTREIKLKEILIKNFVPEEEVVKVAKMAVWNAEIEEYCLKKVDSRKMQFVKRPVSALGLKRAVSEQARMLKTFGVLNPRHASDNIMQLDLFLPEQTTEEFNGLASEKV